MECDGMERDMFGPNFSTVFMLPWTRLGDWSQLLFVAASGQVAVILDPSAVEPSESLGNGWWERYGKI